VRRDVAMVAGELRGHRAPTLVPRRAAAARSRYDAWEAASIAAPTPHAFEVARVIRETDDARTFELRAAGPFSFVAGQFLTLHVPLDGVDHRRAYSISSSPDGSDRVRITVKRLAKGRVSRHLVEQVRQGDRLVAHGPSGSFVVPAREAGSSARHVVLVAGGSGITPIASIVRDVLATDPSTRITLVYGNRSERDAIFRDELEKLATSHTQLTLIHVLEAPETDGLCVVGVPDRETFGRLLDERRLLEARAGEGPLVAMTCGPTAMMSAVREALEARGVAPSQILEERFLSPADPGHRPRAAGPQLVTIRARGVVREVQVSPDQTVLEAALAQGVALPFSCQMGGCGACRCKGAGELVMDEPNCLTDAEKREGHVLTCVSRALGPSSLELLPPPGQPRGPR
ncbi:MAG: ferredoxin--NADP reductase, partial [Sandaracinaceae bacterium]|nr:ferredoxin--NADP reductase [Sandaracinaceae bacterium]